jgi:hypothetical protein
MIKKKAGTASMGVIPAYPEARMVGKFPLMYFQVTSVY